MKIAILTQPLGKNYGGMMQAWALQNVLLRMGHSVITLNRISNKPHVFYIMARNIYRFFLKKTKLNKSLLFVDEKMPYILKNTSQFISSNIRMSEVINSQFALNKNFDREGYDAVIVGSDQTWRPKYSPNIYNYFLDFLGSRDILRIAYATSFGVDDWEYNNLQTARCAVLAQMFDAIGVREQSAVELCLRNLNVKAQHVLDPTLLLEKADYEELIGINRINSEAEGLYCYFLDESSEKKSFTDELGKKLNCPLFSCKAKRNINARFIENLSDYIIPDPLEWLAGFANAKYVITDSFHGMVFSIIFGKPFIVIVNKERGAERFFSLLNALGLSSDQINAWSDMNINSSDFVKVDNHKLKIFQRDSVKFIESALSNKPYNNF